MTPALRLLGAERQAASSLALAYPERRFVFLTDRAVADGWDIPNVELRADSPARDGLDRAGAVALCPRWLPEDARQRWSLSAAFARLAALGFARLAPVGPAPQAGGRWQVKGDAFHRPDDPVSGKADDLADIDDPHGCGLLYQPRLAATAHYLAVGRRAGATCAFGILRVHAERFFRDDVIQAAQTVAHPEIAAETLRALALLDYEGFFSLNWVEGPQGPVLTSFRPVPRAGFGVLRRQGADLLAPAAGVVTARPGGGFVTQPHYAAYTRLEA